MKRKEPSSATDIEIALKRARTALLDNGKARAAALGWISFPEAVSRIVGDYVSDSEREYVVAALVGVQPITLCLSQDVNSPLGTCWSMGFLPSDHQWGSWNAKIDKQFPIADVDDCLFFLDQTDSNDCRIAVEVLVVKLRLPPMHSPSALDDLRNTVGMLQGHLESIKHVVFSITEHSSLCFTLKNSPGDATGFPPPMDHQQILLHMIDDLSACWEENHSLTPVDLFAFYFTSGIQQASEVYLAKFVISLNHPLNRVLFKKEASRVVNNKIMWIYYVKSNEDFDDFEPDAARLCHAIRLDTSALVRTQGGELGERLARASFYQNNLRIERIVIDNPNHFFTVKLPRPSATLTDTTPLSALVELTLKGKKNTLHLTQLNNGYFPHLAHLSIIGGHVTGHLDSTNVPRLKTLILEPGSEYNQSLSEVGPLIRGRCQSLIHAGRPWQLVATKKPGGWSLASYDEFFANPQDEVKDDTIHPHSLPLIRELLLVMRKQSNADEWQSQLRGGQSLKEAVGNHGARLLVWAPQCVQRITAFCVLMKMCQLKFKEEIPEQTRILASFTSYNMNVALDGNVLPNLQSLEVNGGKVVMSGTFTLLEALSLEKTSLQSPWQLDAPSLRSLRCLELGNGLNLSLSPLLLPHLAFLQLRLLDDAYDFFPKILDDGNDLGFSHVTRVVLEGDLTKFIFFKRCQVNNVSHLELTMNTLYLPACWFDTVWQCETLKVALKRLSMIDEDKNENLLTLELPPLPEVKILTVAENDCRVLLNTEMLKLAECTVASPASFGPNLKCPVLQRIRFTDQLSKNDKEYCLNHATYVAIGARPREICFVSDYELHTMTWDVAPRDSEVFPLSGSL